MTQLLSNNKTFRWKIKIFFFNLPHEASWFGASVFSSIRKESTLEGDCRNTVRCHFFLLNWNTPYTEIIRLIPHDAVVEKRSHEPQNMDGCNSDALIIGCRSSPSQLSEQKRTSFSYSAFHKKKRLDNSLTPLITHKKQPRQTDQIKHNYRIITRRASFLAHNTGRFCVFLSSNDPRSKCCWWLFITNRTIFQ